jgi:putative Mn2+ efflux pump MntP
LEHVAGSIAFGLIGAMLGIILGKIEFLEAWRGNLAAQALIIIGFTYCVWGLHRALKNHPHKHAHQDGTITPWVLFTIFVLGLVERFSHALAGATVCASGLAIQFLGL